MRQILIMIVLVLLVQVVIHFGVGTGGDAESLTMLTTGFILVGAYTMGELSRWIRLPALLGYLAAGVLFGPKLVGMVLGDPSLAPLGSQAIQDLGLINVLAVGVIGTMGGGEIKLPELRENLGKLVGMCASVFVLVLPIVGGIVLGLTFIAPSLVPFLSDLPLSGRIAGALLFGALAVGMSPAATLALLQEVRARGKFTSLVLGVVVLGDLILVATFLLVLALAKLLISPEGLSVETLGAELPHIAAEFGWAIVIGLVVGFVFILYLKFVRREVLLFSLAVVFVTAFVAARLHAETLLAFLIAGFVVQNFSRHGHTLVEAFERIALPVFVIYFTAQAANLDLAAVTAYLPLTLILVAVRVGLFYVGIGFGARKAGIDDAQRRHLQVSFFSQGGVDLVLAAMVAEAIPGWGAEVQTVTMATILFYVVGGPPLLARALDSVGESAAARERGAEQLAATDKQASSSNVPAQDGRAVGEFAFPHAPAPELVGRLGELRAIALGLRDDLIDAGVLARARRRQKVLVDLSATIRATLEVLGPEPKEPNVRAAEKARARLDAAIVEAGRSVEIDRLSPLDRASLTALFETLDHAQDYGQSVRVARSGHLFEPIGGRVTRVIRWGRRVRRAVVGPGHRTVALGRLWRYHVSLAVPVALWRVTRPVDAELWHATLSHYRSTRAQLDAIVDGSWATVPAPSEADEHADPHHDDHDPAEAEADHEHTEPVAVEPPQFAAWITQAQADASAREQAIADRLTQDLAQLERGLVCGLADAWNQFLDSVELAGTLELPAWRNRPSTRYDAAQAAIADLLERSDNDHEAGSGRFDALLGLAHAEHVATVIHRSAQLFEYEFTTALTKLDHAFEPLLGARDPNAVALDQALRGMSDHVERLRRQLAALAQAEPAELRWAIAATPAQLAPSITLEPITGEPDPRRTIIRLQAWLTQTLVSDFRTARATADEELGTGLDALRQALTHVRRVVEYHREEAREPDGEAVTASVPPPSALANSVEPIEPVAKSDLAERLTGLLGLARAQVQELGRLTTQHVEETIHAAEQAGLEPIRKAEWDELRRRLRRLDEGPRAAVVDWVRETGAAVVDRVRSSAHSLGDEVSALFADRHTEVAVAAWHRSLFGPRSSMPTSYQRLFTSVAAETVGLLIPRPELAPLEAATERWLSGRGGTILLYGDRGVGKRTLVRQLVAKLGDRIELHWLRLLPTLEREHEVVRELAPWLGVRVGGLAANFSSLQAQVQAVAPTALDRAVQRIDDGEIDPPSGHRRMIVVENGERLFRRTPAGLARVRRFLDLIAATSEEILWVVLMAEPAVAVLDAAVELRARFPTAVRVPPMTAEQLTTVVDTRHRLSGYGLRIEASVPTLSEWLREPLRGRLWRSREDAAYVRLAQLSGGNVRQALRLWLTAVEIDPVDPTIAVLRPLPGHACPVLDQLPLSSRVLLAALLLQGPLSRADLLALHGPHALDVDAELARLVHLGLVTFDADRVVSVETRLVQPLTSELRACNLL